MYILYSRQKIFGTASYKVRNTVCRLYICSVSVHEGGGGGGMLQFLFCVKNHSHYFSDGL